MLTTMENYLFRLHRQLRRWGSYTPMRTALKVSACAGSGFLLSAASLSHAPQPLALGLVCAVTGWRALVMAAGAALGYRIFWGQPGLQGVFWALGGCILSLILGKRKPVQDMPLLLPALSSLLTALTGLGFLFFRQGTSFLLFFLRVLLAPVSAWFFHRAVLRKSLLTRWICGGIGVLALAQIVPVPGLSLGAAAVGVMAVWAAFPGAMLAGLGLDLAQITPLPMSVVVGFSWFARQLPFRNQWIRCTLPALSAVAVMVLCGIWDPSPIPALALGGLLGCCLPPERANLSRRGETGLAQVRLELSAGVMTQLQQLLLEISLPPVDPALFLQQAVSRACDDCPVQENCLERTHLNIHHLYEPTSFACRRQEQIRSELFRSQERLRSVKADRIRQQEYRSALIQQYQFLSTYLQQLSDQLPRRTQRPIPMYRLEVSARSKGKERSNGDRCMAFSGGGCRYYILLCDGMGTGIGACQEGESAGELMRRILSAGFPPEYALRTINSILALRGQAGAVTLDLAEIRLDTGQAILYKWGAAPSWLWKQDGAKKLGTAMPPPGISVTGIREEVIRLSLRRGEVLILVSDGVEAGECLHRLDSGPVLPPGELAQWLLEKCTESGEDDATVAVMRIHRRQPST